jgi:hypothetical protein
MTTLAERIAEVRELCATDSTIDEFECGVNYGLDKALPITDEQTALLREALDALEEWEPLANTNPFCVVGHAFEHGMAGHTTKQAIAITGCEFQIPQNARRLINVYAINFMP